LDESGLPVPAGVPGELCLGGERMARGYLGRPDLTAERFVPDHLSGKAGARLYRTGDLVRHLQDGTIEFLGRFDTQVKIRGFRIELGEIEAVLLQDPAVSEAVVLAREDMPGEKKLVAYVAGKNGSRLAVNDLRESLKAKLPEYMIPSAFVGLDAMPLNAVGKIDRRALPPPDQDRPEVAQDYVAPRTPVEEELAGIVAQVLGVQRVGVRDDFFDLGGHSMLAIQVVSRVRELYLIDLQLRSLFESPTVEGLAREIAGVLLNQTGGGEAGRFLDELDQISDEQATRLLRDNADALGIKEM
jgi:acyl carrier protein